jgi:hypothetical protein
LEKAPADRQVKAIQILPEEALSAFKEWDENSKKQMY